MPPPRPDPPEETLSRGGAAGRAGVRSRRWRRRVCRREEAAPTGLAVGSSGTLSPAAHSREQSAVGGPPAPRPRSPSWAPGRCPPGPARVPSGQGRSPGAQPGGRRPRGDGQTRAPPARDLTSALGSASPPRARPEPIPGASSPASPGAPSTPSSWARNPGALRGEGGEHQLSDSSGSGSAARLFGVSSPPLPCGGKCQAGPLTVSGLLKNAPSLSTRVTAPSPWRKRPRQHPQVTLCDPGSQAGAWE